MAVKAAQLLKKDFICVDSLIAIDGVNGPPIKGPNAKPWANPGNITRITNVMAGKGSLVDFAREFIGAEALVVPGDSSAPPGTNCADKADAVNNSKDPIKPKANHGEVPDSDAAKDAVKAEGELWGRQGPAGKAANCCGNCK